MFRAFFLLLCLSVLRRGNNFKKRRLTTHQLFLNQHAEASKKGTIFLATFSGFLEAKLSKNLPFQTFHNKNFTFYALKHKNHKEMTRKNVHFFGHLLYSETIRSDTIKKSVNSIRCYQIAFRGLGNHAVRLLGPFRALEIHAESLADTFSTPRKPPGTPHRDLFEPSETMRNASPIPFRPLGNRAESLAASNPRPRKSFFNKIDSTD